MSGRDLYSCEKIILLIRNTIARHNLSIVRKRRFFRHKLSLRFNLRDRSRRDTLDIASRRRFTKEKAITQHEYRFIKLNTANKEIAHVWNINILKPAENAWKLIWLNIITHHALSHSILYSYILLYFLTFNRDLYFILNNINLL